jgi:transmembrane sensor
VSPESDSASPVPATNGAPQAAGSDAEETSRTRTDRRPARPNRARRWGRWVGAAVVALLVAVAGIWMWHQPVRITAAPGQQQTATLPDGSTVELNSGTTLTYRRGFESWPFVTADRRVVHLDGEAFFSVEDGTRPFVVETASARVVVTGTRFNVHARPVIDSTTAVTVTEGAVRVQARGRPDQAVVLDERGQTSRVRTSRAAPTSPQTTEVSPILAWRQNGFAVTEAPLSRVTHELEQRYDTVIRLHGSVKRTNAPLSLYYPKPTPLSTILRDLCTALDLNYRPTSRGYELFEGPNGG